MARIDMPSQRSPMTSALFAVVSLFILATLLRGCYTAPVHVDGHIRKEKFIIIRAYLSDSVKFFVHVNHPTIEMKHLRSKYATRPSQSRFNHHDFLEQSA